MFDKFRLVFEQEFEKILMTKYENGLIHYFIKPNSHLTFDDITSITEFSDKKGFNGKYLNLYEFGENSDANNDVRSWAAKDSGNHHTVADAFVINSLAQKMIADFYLKFHKPERPTKVFNNREKAVKWLLSFQDQVV